MWAFCFFVTIIGCISSTDRSHVVSAYTVSDKVNRRLLELEDEADPDRCEYTNWGKEFLLAVTEQLGAGTFIYMSCTTVTTINVFAPYVNMNKTLQIRSGTQLISLDDKLMNHQNELTNKGVYVTADNPISIYVIENFNIRLDAAEGYLALPISAISTEYIVVTDNTASRTKSQFVIAALENNTIVNVTFKTTGKVNINGIKYSSGTVFSQEMSTLDTFQVQHEQDLTGTFIQSSKPTAVFSGCKCGFGRLTGGSCQHEVEQIVPICSLGQEYITVPLFPAYRYRIISPFSNTIASIQGHNYTMESGNFLERWDTKPIYIHTSKPVMVMEYGECTVTNGSDPSMITLLPISTFSINATFGLPENLTGSDIRDYLLVIIETDMADGLMLDRQRLYLESRYTVSTASRENYTILVTNITSGYHKLYHPDTSVRYGAVLYGTGQWTSFGFPLGYHTETTHTRPSQMTYTTYSPLHSTMVSTGPTDHTNIHKAETTFSTVSKSTTDIDECANKTLCDYNIYCVNKDGNYSCKCKPGYYINEDVLKCIPAKFSYVGYVTIIPNTTDIPKLRKALQNWLNTTVFRNLTGFAYIEILAIDHTFTNRRQRRATDASMNFTYIVHSNEQTTSEYLQNLTVINLSGCENVCVSALFLVIKSSLNIAPDIALCETRGSEECDPVSTKCTAANGTYECTCKTGFERNLVSEKFCIDINECNDTKRCDVNAECHNTVGSYTCTCKNGFTGTGTTCTDIDECTGTHSCHVNAECHNIVGSYNCNCKNGFSGSGTTCTVTGNMSRPVVRSEIQWPITDGNQLVFHCDFDPSSDPSVMYQVTWYRNMLEAESKLMSFTPILYSSREQYRSLTYLPETYITLGMTIFCTIYAKQLNITVPSEPYFVGFEVISKDSLTLQDLEETSVLIRLTVPFGCRRQNEECFLGVNMFYTEPGADNCLLPAAVALSNCGVRISSWRWNQSYPLRIALKHGQNLLITSIRYNIRLRTDKNFDHDFFRNYTLPMDIKVEVTTNASSLNGKECHAICDPHMQTFDGRDYENQNEGTYILYKHLKSPVQVQMRTNPCYGFRKGPPFCPCGVAIAAGRDVFVVDRCSIPIKIYMPQCDDGSLQGKIKSDGYFYQIYLPSGSWVKITSGISFNIYMYPSVLDRMSTSGLCGYLDSDVQNDFVLRNGTTVPENKFEDFNSNWQVKPEEDLFNNSNYKFLPSWPREDYLCICGQYQEGHISQSDNCSPDSRKFCPESSLNDTSAADCSRKLSTNVNVPIQLDPRDYNVSQSENDTTTEFETMRNLTEHSANYECWSYLNSSLLFEKCSKVPDMDSKSFAKTCAKDALITKTMFWAPTHLDNAQKKCIYQVTVNQPLPEQIIKKYNITSISDEQASNETINGTGQCHCYKGYGGNDCSVDLNKPPDVYGIPNRGVCDLNETPCDRISVLGDNFADSKNLSCRLSLFQVKVNETRFHDNDSIVLKAKWISFAEVSCPIADVRSKRSIQFVDDLDTLAIGYRVAVGNTREIFGRNISLLILDSLCVDCIKAGFDITCTLKDGFDLINKRCIKKLSAEKKAESGSTVLIISAVVGSVLVVIVVGVLLHYCLVVRTRRAEYERENRERTYIELQEMEKEKEYYGTLDEVYDEIKDLSDDYSAIRDIVPTGDESKDSEGNYVKLGNTQKNESEGYSYLNKLATNECVSNARKHKNNKQEAPTEETNIRYQKRPLPAKIEEEGDTNPNKDVRY